MWLGAAAVAGAGLTASCATVRGISAQQTGCAPREIEISEDTGGGNPRTWVATCRGQRFRCFHVTAGSSQCAPDQAASVPPAPASGTAVRRVQAVAPNGAPVTLLVGDLDAGVYHFHVEAAPSVDPTTVRWTISAPLQILGPACQASVTIDGVVTDFTVLGVQAVGDRGEYTTTLPMVAVRAMAMGGRVVGRICNDEWRLDDLAANVIRVLAARIDEEVASLAPPPPPGGPQVVPAPP